MDASLGYEKNNKQETDSDNKRNGLSPKTVKSQYGTFDLDIPRDRNSVFEPKIIPKYQRDISGIEEQVISLYARGLSTRDEYSVPIEQPFQKSRTPFSGKAVHTFPGESAAIN